MEDNYFILALKQTFTWDWIFYPLAFISFWAIFILLFFTYRYIEKNVLGKKYSEEFKPKIQKNLENLNKILYSHSKSYFLQSLQPTDTYESMSSQLKSLLRWFLYFIKGQFLYFINFTLFGLKFLIISIRIFLKFFFDVLINKQTYSKEHKFIWLFRVALFFMMVSIIYILQK